MVSGRRLAARLTPDALRQVRGGHPWVYADAITSITDGGRSGDLAVIFDDRRRFAAIGLFDPDSPIRIKVLHRGSPTTIDQDWWTTQIGEALARRATLAADPATTAWRVVHGENDGLPGLVVDRYADTAVIKLYSAALAPHLDDIVAALLVTLGPERIVLRTGRLATEHLPSTLTDGLTLVGDAPSAPIAYRELGLDFSADVVRGQKTGGFLDQRENRGLVAAHSAGGTVLDVFCCTGGFGVHAAAAGATAIHFVDQSPGAIAAARANMAANAGRIALRPNRIDSTVGDAFEVMTAMASTGRRFDVVIVDPPSFAPNRAAIPAALRAYGHLTDLALRLVNRGGLVFQASCSSRVTTEDFMRVVNSTAVRAGASWTELARTGQPLDHPIGFPQGAYLKAVLAKVDRYRG
jgi:23S rRNA (cytosine1962-C5)-methyltransferase